MTYTIFITSLWKLLNPWCTVHLISFVDTRMLSHRLPASLSRTICAPLVIGASSPRRYASTAHPAGSELLSSVWTHGSDIVVDRAEGSWIYGTDGRTYLIKIILYYGCSFIILTYTYILGFYLWDWSCKLRYDIT